MIEQNILRWLCQNRNGYKYCEHLPEDIFIVPEKRECYRILSEYLLQYQITPEPDNLLDYAKKWFARHRTTLDKRKIIQGITDCFEVIEDSEYIKKEVSGLIQKRMMQTFFISNKDQLGSDEAYEALDKLIHFCGQKLRSLDEDGYDEELFTESWDKPEEQYKVLPTYLKGLNALTSAGGFYAPQLILITAPPKGFKTGLVLNLIIEWALQGKKILYIDGENGIEDIRIRVKQNLGSAEEHQLSTAYTKAAIKENVDVMKANGGEIASVMIPSTHATMKDVERYVAEFVGSEKGFKPDVIVYDYLDLYYPKTKDKRIGIQDAYHHAIFINKKYEAVGITMSHVNRAAAKLKKKAFSMEDLSEDYGKAANAHAGFALWFDENENQTYLVPIFQRKGVSRSSGKMVRLDIRHEIQRVYEVEDDLVENYLQDVKDSEPVEWQ